MVALHAALDRERRRRSSRRDDLTIEVRSLGQELQRVRRAVVPEAETRAIALEIARGAWSRRAARRGWKAAEQVVDAAARPVVADRSEEPTSELQSLMRI